MHRQERFYYASHLVNLWEWDACVLEIGPGVDGDNVPLCMVGRGGAPPQYCGGPTGYRLMLKRQMEGGGRYEPERVEAAIRALAAAEPDATATMWETLREVLKDGWESVDRRLDEHGPLAPHVFSLREANARLAERVDRGEVPVRFRVEVVCVKEDGSEEHRTITELDRRELVMETLGLTLAEGKTILEVVQDVVTSEHVAEDLQRRRPCTSCGASHTIKDGGTTAVRAPPPSRGSSR